MIIMRHNICIYLFAILLIFASCDNCYNKRLEPNVEIIDAELRNAILEYDSIIRHQFKDEKYILSLSEITVNDSVTKILISYDLGTAWLQDSPISLAKVKDKYVLVSSGTTYFGILATEKALQKEIARRYFPEEYRLLEKGKVIDDYIVNDAPWMELTFCKGKFIKKRMPRLWVSNYCNTVQI